MPGSLAKFRTPDSNKTMGIEIECLLRRRDDSGELVTQSVVGNHYGFFYCYEDGSIEADYSRQVGREFVSQPLPCGWLKKEIHKLSHKWEWDQNSTCGVHVHVSRKWLSLKKATAIHAFLYGLSEDMRKYLFGRYRTMYCAYRSKIGGTRYDSVNIENSQTIEFRMFRSGDAAWCCYCVDMVEYLIENAYHLNEDAVEAFRILKLGK